MNTNICALCGVSGHHMFDRAQCGEQTDDKIQTNYKYLYTKTDDFIRGLVENEGITNEDMQILVSNYISALTDVETYMLAKDTKHFMRDIQHGNYEFHPNYFMCLLQAEYLDEIFNQRFERTLSYITSASNRYIMYDRIVEHFRPDYTYSSGTIILYLELNIKKNVYTKHVEVMLTHALNRVKANCKIDSYCQGARTYTWLGSPVDVNPLSH